MMKFKTNITLVESVTNIVMIRMKFYERCYLLFYNEYFTNKCESTLYVILLMFHKIKNREYIGQNNNNHEISFRERENTMYCKKCGTLNNDDANYCELCGNRLEKNMRAEKELTTELNSDNLLKGSKSSDGEIKYLMAGISITIAIIFCIGMIFSKGSLLTDTKNSISNRNQSQKSEQGLNESSREYHLIEDNIVNEKQESENMK